MSDTINKEIPTLFKTEILMLENEEKFTSVSKNIGFHPIVAFYDIYDEDEEEDININTMPIWI